MARASAAQMVPALYDFAWMYTFVHSSSSSGNQVKAGTLCPRPMLGQRLWPKCQPRHAQSHLMLLHAFTGSPGLRERHQSTGLGPEAQQAASA